MFVRSESHTFIMLTSNTDTHTNRNKFRHAHEQKPFMCAVYAHSISSFLFYACVVCGLMALTTIRHSRSTGAKLFAQL